MLKDLQAKPSCEDDVLICPIPNSDDSLHLWGKGLESKCQYCLDFVCNVMHLPINFLFEYELWVAPNKSAPWLPGVESHI